jgi:hypothetical protein
MSRQPLHADAAGHRRHPQFPAALNVHLHPHAGRRAPRTLHQPVALTVSGSVRKKRVVPPANRMPRVAGRQPTRLGVSR